MSQANDLPRRIIRERGVAELKPWGSPVERERRRRIKLAVWAYAYEIKSNPLVPDGVFDEEALKVDLSVDTGRPDLDAWFRANFQPHTGSWVWRHPEPGKLNRLYRQAKESL